MRLQAHRVSAVNAETPRLVRVEAIPNRSCGSNGFDQSLPQPRDHNTPLRRCHGHY